MSWGEVGFAPFVLREVCFGVAALRQAVEEANPAARAAAAPPLPGPMRVFARLVDAPGGFLDVGPSSDDAAGAENDRPVKTTIYYGSSG